MTSLSHVREVEALVAQLRRGARPKYLFFWGHQPSKDGSITKSCFSQWYAAPFTVNGVPYRTAEHMMMAEKARVFGDHATRDRILVARSPAEAKKLGRAVQRFDETLWAQARFGIVVEANRAKFSQHPALRDFLLDTGDRVLVEASPVDPVWGSGLGADHPDAGRPQRWRGRNLLGFALMEVRSSLAGA